MLRISRKVQRDIDYLNHLTLPTRHSMPRETVFESDDDARHGQIMENDVVNRDGQQHQRQIAVTLNKFKELGPLAGLVAYLL